MIKNSPQIILASGSRYRAELLQRLQLKFQIEVPAIDETPKIGEAPLECALRLAVQKAQAVALQNPQALVVSSDQVAEFNNHIIGKPESAEAAVEQLLAFSGARVAFHTAVSLINTATGFSASAADTTWVHFRELGRAEIERYVELEKPLNCAGSFKCEALGISLFNRIETNDPTALIGLPLIALCHMLREAGLQLPLMARSQDKN